MASPPHFDDVSPNIFHPSPLAFSRAICLTFSISSQTQDFDFGGGFSGTQSGNKRPSPDYDEDEYENDPFGHKKAKSKAEEAASGVTTGMILSLRESLQNCKDMLATCQNELEAAKSEIQKWHSSFQNEPFISAGTTPAPKSVINYLQALKSSEESLREQLEKAKKKEAAFIVTFAKREQEIAELKCAAMQALLRLRFVMRLKSWHNGVAAIRSYGGYLLSAVRDLKSQFNPASMQARRLLLDPAVHEEFTRLKNLVEEKDKKVKELQDNIAAVNFTPQSKMGKMLMAKCRTLQEENEEIGNQASEGKMHELAMKLSVQKYQNAELRCQFEGLQKHMDGLTNDVDRSNEMVFSYPYLHLLMLFFSACLLRLMLYLFLTNNVRNGGNRVSSQLQWVLLQVLMLQDKLEEKDQEIQRLKDELQPKSLVVEDEKTDPASNRNYDETIPTEAAK
ncbi:hypothetical protein JHK87_011630 [Glycine soja]|nr:hypothetical protein JHK87_011630 [Glycine soja]